MVNSRENPNADSTSAATAVNLVRHKTEAKLFVCIFISENLAGFLLNAKTKRKNYYAFVDEMAKLDYRDNW